MRKFILSTCIALGLLLPLAAADNVTGLWKIISDKTNKPTAYVLLYTYGGKLYGRMMATIDDKTDKIKNTINAPWEHADKVAGNPFMCGLDFVYEMEDRGREWGGSILDPESGDDYDCKIWKEGTKIIVRGELRGWGWLGFTGRNQTWMPAVPTDIDAKFVLPDPKTFVPVIPRKK